TAGSSGARGCLLRDRSGALHAVIVPGSAAVPAGRTAVAGGGLRGDQGGGPFGNLAGPDPAGMGAGAAVVRSSGAANRTTIHSRGLVSELAPREHRRQYPGRS